MRTAHSMVGVSILHDVKHAANLWKQQVKTAIYKLTKKHRFVANITPGSDLAISKGCLCPVLDNCHGRGLFGHMGHSFYIVEGCPIHNPKSKSFLYKVLKKWTLENYNFKVCITTNFIIREHSELGVTIALSNTLITAASTTLQAPIKTLT